MAGKVGDQIAYLIARTGWHLDAELKTMSGASGLPIEQCRILDLLHERDGCPMSELAQHALVEAPTLTKIVDRMVADALVYRAPDIRDRRRVMIFLSDKGRACFEALRPLFQARERRLARRLGKAGLADLRRLLRTLAPDADGVAPSGDVEIARPRRGRRPHAPPAAHEGPPPETFVGGSPPRE
jgi:DNA-binding MarR family transcriptional regulator